MHILIDAHIEPPCEHDTCAIYTLLYIIASELQAKKHKHSNLTKNPYEIRALELNHMKENYIKIELIK